MAVNRSEIHLAVLELQQSVVVRGIKNKLTELDYKITEIGPDIKEVIRYAGKVDLFVLYLSDVITDNVGSMSLLTQVLEETDLSEQKMILIGEKDYLDDIVRRKKALGNYEQFVLPIDENKLGQFIDDVVSDGEESARKRILIVDDDPAYAKVVRGWIGGTYQTNIVTNGTQAIKFLGKNQVDLILLDYEMPIIDGPKVLEMIRNEENVRDIPVVFLTGIGTRESVERVMSLGPAGYILKSTNRDDLLAKIKGVLSKTS